MRFGVKIASVSSFCIYQQPHTIECILLLFDSVFSSQAADTKTKALREFLFGAVAVEARDVQRWLEHLRVLPRGNTNC